MKKNKFFSFGNLVVAAKGIVNSVVASLIALIPSMATRWLIMVKQMPVLGLILGIFTLALYLFCWGFVGNRIWGWK